MKMKRYSLTNLLIAALFMLSAGYASGQEGTFGVADPFIYDDSLYETGFHYFIGPGDELDIKVWRHPDLDMSVIVRPDCMISMPIANEVFVCNATIPESREQIASQLKKTLKNPQVAVNVRKFVSQKIFVLGEVERPGLYPFAGRITVLDALSKAGGYDKETAALKSVMLIRGGYGPDAQVMSINMQDVLRGKNYESNIFLRAGDIIFVPKSFISKVNKFINQFFTKTDPVLKYYLDIIDIEQRTPPIR